VDQPLYWALYLFANDNERRALESVSIADARTVLADAKVPVELITDDLLFRIPPFMGSLTIDYLGSKYRAEIRLPLKAEFDGRIVDLVRSGRRVIEEATLHSRDDGEIRGLLRRLYA
jgi:hypothetical protein